MDVFFLTMCDLCTYGNHGSIESGYPFKMIFHACLLPEKNSICLIALNLREYVPICDVFGVMHIVCFFFF